jgi:hypothetical protein
MLSGVTSTPATLGDARPARWRSAQVSFWIGPARQWLRVSSSQYPMCFLKSKRNTVYILSYPFCLRAGRNARADTGFAVLAGLETVTLSCAALSIALCTSGVVLVLYWLLSRVVGLVAG